jgi:hypothetical protein
MVSAAAGRRIGLGAACAVLAACGQPEGEASQHGRDASGADDAAEAFVVPEAGDAPLPGFDPGTVAIHRLNNNEYDNTVRDLLGVITHARDTFVPDERDDFDNTADYLSMNDARYELYFQSAEATADAAFSHPASRDRVVVCAPVDAADTACVERVVRTFGARAWRRPLTDEEVSGFVALVAAERAAGKDADGAFKTLVTAMLSSLSFLYRVEIDPDPTSHAPHAVGPYELASRLSYWLWSTMPDDALFALAASGELLRPETLAAQLQRMLGDPRADAFVESFAGQWLGIREIAGESIDPLRYPQWDEAARPDLVREMQLYFMEFLRGDRPFDQFLTADFNFVNARLAKYYGVNPAGLGDALQRVAITTDAREGFLGLGGAIFTMSATWSDLARVRGLWILREVLCDDKVSFAAEEDHPLSLLESIERDGEKPVPIRDQIARILATPGGCAKCHASIEPLGLGFETFDRVGQARVGADATGMLADGTPFSGEPQLAALLAADPRFLDCTVRMALTYALGRALTDDDAAHLSLVRRGWAAEGLGLRALLARIVLDDTFRFRRGEGP